MLRGVRRRAHLQERRRHARGRSPRAGGSSAHRDGCAVHDARTYARHDLPARSRAVHGGAAGRGLRAGAWGPARGVPRPTYGRGGRALRFRGILRRRRCAACFVGGRAHLPVHGVRDVCGHLGAQRAVLHHLGRHAARARDAERLRSADGGVAGVLRGRAVPAQGVPRPPAAVLLRQLARQAEATGKPVRGGRGGRPARVRPVHDWVGLVSADGALPSGSDVLEGGRVHPASAYTCTGPEGTFPRAVGQV